jgi:hypothetical protein
MLVVLYLSALLAVAISDPVADVKGQRPSDAKVRGKRTDDMGSMEVVVQHLSQQVNSLTAQLNQQATEIAALKAKDGKSTCCIKVCLNCERVFTLLYIVLPLLAQVSRDSNWLLILQSTY